MLITRVCYAQLPSPKLCRTTSGVTIKDDAKETPRRFSRPGSRFCRPD